MAAVVAVGFWLLSTFGTQDLHARTRIAVLPFENLGGADEEYFSEGVTRDINTRIAGIGDFVVIAHGSAWQAKATGQSYRDMARQVARALNVTLSPQAEAELAAAPTDNLQAYQEYLLGFFAWEKRTLEGFQEAIRYFERAIALDGRLAQPHATLGLVHEWQFEWEASEREFLRAIELDPEYATARHWYGLLLCRMGRYRAGIAETRLSLELDPLSPMINQDVGYALTPAAFGVVTAIFGPLVRTRLKDHPRYVALVEKVGYPR